MSGLIINKELFFSIAISVISVLLTLQSFNYPPESSQFPRFLCILMLLFSFLILIRTLKNKEGEKTMSTGSGFISAAKLPVTVFASTAAYLFCIGYVGYFVSTVIYMSASMFFFGERRPLPIAAAVLVFLAVIYALFVSFLGLRLPEGILF
ncbi:tripartite tricarboxylate transporter TctB family protein [Cloacibacillus porcorum]